MNWLQDLIYKWEARLVVLEARADQAFEQKALERFGTLRDNVDAVRLHIERLKRLEPRA